LTKSSETKPNTKEGGSTLDVTGLLCPIPVLRTRRVLDDMHPGQKLVVKASDPASVQDMPAFCKMTGHTLRMARVEDGIFIFEIEKAVTEPSADNVVVPLRQIQK